MCLRHIWGMVQCHYPDLSQVLLFAPKSRLYIQSMVQDLVGRLHFKKTKLHFLAQNWDDVQ